MPSPPRNTHPDPDGAPQDPDPAGLAPGAAFGEYQIEARLATGGMAEIWRARVQGMEKRVIVKTMLPEFRARQDLVGMFINEASLAARLSHPNVVDILDFGHIDGRYFIAMEYVPGVTLRFALKRALAGGAPLRVPAVLHLMRDVCEALDHVHDLGDAEGPLDLVHGDVSPDNILISTGGIAKLIDFGATRATARVPPPRTFVGKYRYAAPERIRRGIEDRRSDVYSVGVILFECLTGVRPFVGSEAEIIAAATARESCDPLSAAPFLEPTVAAVVRKATAQSPADRHQSASALGIALARCLADLGAGNKEREVTMALADVLYETADRGREQTIVAEPIPEAIESPEASSSTGAIVLNEAEIVDASGPIGLVLAPSPLHADTRRVTLPVPPEAVRPVRPERSRPVELAPPTISIFDRRSGEPRPSARSSLERAVAHFDRGLELRQAGRYGPALDAWEVALALAPSNYLYQSHVRRLREQLSALRA